MTTLEVALAEPPVALALEPPVALVMCVVPEWEAEAVAEPEEDSVAEADDSELEAEAEAELEADSEAEVGAADVEAAAEEPAEEPEPTLAQKVWTAGRTWSERSSHVSYRRTHTHKDIVDGWGFHILMATSWPQALRTQPVARVVN